MEVKDNYLTISIKTQSQKGEKNKIIMKIHILIVTIGFLCMISCTGQEKKLDKNENEKESEKTAEQPKGTWKVDKEFDEKGNLIRYDSIYSWSSEDRLNDFSSIDKDSLLSSFESKFYSQFSQFKNQGFDNIFNQDSLFSKKFFNDDFFESDFGKDFMDIDKVMKNMIKRQEKFLKKYKSEFNESEDK